MILTVPSPALRRCFAFPFFLLLIAGLSVPSDGSHSALNIKSLTFGATTVSLMAYVLMVKKISLYQWKVICFLLCSIIFLMTWSMIGLYNQTPEHSIMEQAKVLWLTVSLVGMSAYVVSEGLMSFKSFLKTILFTNFAYSVLKIIFVILHLLGIVNLWSLMETLGIRFMSMDIYGALPRFQTSIDIVTPFLLFFFLQAPRFEIVWSRTFKTVYLTVTLLAIFLSFSRFLTFIAIVSLVLHTLTLSSGKLLRILPLFLVGVGLFVSWIGIDNIYFVFERRFLSSDTFQSDQVRSYQIQALMNEFSKYPILGKGLGGFADESIRDPALPYSYEVQWAASLMQFGIVGLTILLIPLGIITSKILWRPLTKEKIALFVLFFGWLAAGFTNPFLLSLASGIIYSLFLLTGKMNRT